MLFKENTSNKIVLIRVKYQDQITEKTEQAAAHQAHLHLLEEQGTALQSKTHELEEQLAACRLQEDAKSDQIRDYEEQIRNMNEQMLYLQNAPNQVRIFIIFIHYLRI